ncbi:uncharacterized protein [Argopecten irradians]|uniref:uncharacterized protein isoform X1 n=1 Tax=Argopecten irradians TaxID=31199 RepID=UPI0037132381
MRGYPDCQVVQTTENNKLTHHRDVIMGVTIALLVVSVAFNCAFTWNLFSMQNATDNSTRPETTSNKDTQEWASLRRIEAAVNAILAQRHYPSPRAMDSANMTDDVVCEFSHLYEGHFPDKKACDVPISSTTTSATDKHDEQGTSITSNRDTQEWASLRRIEAAVNAILAQRHYPSPRALDSANMTDDVVCEFSHLYEGCFPFPDNKACDVPISSTTTSATDEHDEQGVYVYCLFMNLKLAIDVTAYFQSII